MARAAPRIAVLLLLLHHIHRAVAGFISVNGTAFVDINACGSDPLKLAGFNTYRAVEYAMREPQRMFEQLDSAASAGLNFVRSWAFSTKAEMSLLSSDGSFNEEVLVGLDKFLTACKERNIRVILVLIDWWQNACCAGNRYGQIGFHWRHTFCGVSGFLNTFDPSTTRKYDFYSSRRARNAYKRLMRTIMKRTNTFTGMPYVSDTTIMSFQLINEPRAPDVSTLREWVATMSSFAKSLDPNHLIAVGMEGFFSDVSSDDRRAIKNTLGAWSLSTGQDFSVVNRVETVDYTTVHLWLDNWLSQRELESGPPLSEFDKVERLAALWLDTHANEAFFWIYKPMLLDEHGKSLTNAFGRGSGLQNTAVRRARLQLYRKVHKKVLQQTKSDLPTAGCAFWVLMHPDDEELMDEPFRVLPSSRCAHMDSLCIARDSHWISLDMCVLQWCSVFAGDHWLCPKCFCYCTM